MKKLLSLILALSIGAGEASAQIGPGTNGPFYSGNFYQGFVPTAQFWNLLESNKVDYNPSGIAVQYGGTGATTPAGARANLGIPGVPGTVTSVGLALPSLFTVAGSPVTTTGTLSATFATQTANTVLAGPASGSAAVPTMRALVAADLPGTYANSVSNSDGTLTISPTTGAVVASLALGHANTWTAQQTNQGATTTSPGWYAQLAGDTFPRVRVGLNSTDVASIAFGSGSLARDLFLERAGAATFRFGASDSGTPVAQTVGFQNGSGTNISGVDTTFIASRPTGTGAPGSFIFQTPQQSISSGAALGTPVTVFTISNGNVAVCSTCSLTYGGVQFNAVVTGSGNLVGSSLATLASPTFTGTTTGPDSGTWTSSGFNLGNASTLSWNSDLYLNRVSADILGQRRSTNAQQSRIYNTYTSGTADEWAILDWIVNTNSFTVGTQKNGTGTNRNMIFAPGGTTAVTLNASTGTATFAGLIQTTGIGIGTAPATNPQLRIQGVGTGTNFSLYLTDSGASNTIITAQDNGNVTFGGGAGGTIASFTNTTKAVAFPGSLAIGGATHVNAFDTTGAGTFSGNLAFGGTTFDPFGRAYGKMFGGSSASSVFIELNAATGQAAGIDLGANGVRVGNIYSDSASINIGTIISAPVNFTTGGVTKMILGTTGALTITGGSAPSVAIAGCTIGTDVVCASGTSNFSGAMTLGYMTAGSIPFAGASGLISQNNTSLFWDQSNSRLGIGTGSPDVKLVVLGGRARFNSVSLGGGIYIDGQSNGTTQYNWMVGAQNNVNQGFEITPSTAVGGTTFTTPLITVLGTGTVTLGTAATRVDIAGILRLGNAYVAGAAVQTGTVTLQDSAGNLVRVLVANP